MATPHMFQILRKKINRNAVKQIDQSIVLYCNLSFFWGILISFLISSVDSCSQYSIEPDTLCLSLWNFQTASFSAQPRVFLLELFQAFHGISQSRLHFAADLAVNTGWGWHQQHRACEEKPEVKPEKYWNAALITDCGWGSAKINSHNLKSTAWNSHHLNLK